ncbi:MAG: 3-hydroxybutyryl-CoA dehydrogenase [Bacteroidales bacterium]|jgi:3-hydroxybutyryl-CoA dehydrogenase|nr:3-hydroxybutyryl-CoA dehydrogenase [Bacteroidales bacterium]MDD3299243.1 3-hydroxybutyryl-CoA dehydrogenase [Bacteroidales bacterium]MDD3843667.1 3-hydroxybutyryl-CoA dehydrogenase [Bacteroidales bacterium]
MKICVIGTGTMGSGIAQAFAQAGISVTMVGISEEELESGIKKISQNLSKLVEKGKIADSEMDVVLSRIETSLNYIDCSDADLVIEAVLEQMSLKKEIFSQLDTLCKPETILASNTSSLSITEIASYTRRQSRVIGMHFFNPAPVMKLVEVIKGQLTSPEVQEFVYNLALKIDKTPINVNEAPGFVVNRILVPLVNEAVGIYAEGVASAQEIDQAMKLGANHPMGPLALGDLIGLDVCLAIMEVLHKEFGEDKYRPHPLLRKMVRSGQLGRKSKQGFYKY